jgi:hypothetical protein
VTGPGVKPGGKRTHLIDLIRSAAACKAVYAGSIPTPASKNQLVAASYAQVESPRVAKSRNLTPEKVAATLADDQDFAGILNRVGDFLVVHVIFRSPARADSAVLVMQVLMLRLWVDDTCFCIVRVKLDDMRLAVVDPHDTVIVAHWDLLPCGVKMSSILARGIGEITIVATTVDLTLFVES